MSVTSNSSRHVVAVKVGERLAQGNGDGGSSVDIADWQRVTSADSDDQQEDMEIKVLEETIYGKIRISSISIT